MSTTQTDTTTDAFTKHGVLLDELAILKMEYGDRIALACSFGKDSMALLEAFAEIGVKPAIFWLRDPFFPEKDRYAFRQIVERELRVFTWMPAERFLHVYNGELETVGIYGIGGRQTLTLPRDVVEWDESQDGANFLCAVDWLTQPQSQLVAHNFEALVIGHKNGDDDPLRGKIPLRSSMLQLHPQGSKMNPQRAFFPLMNWNDAEVWEYLNAQGVPLDESRYDVETNTDAKDFKTSQDLQLTCARCVDARRRGEDRKAEVFCPRAQQMIGQAPERKLGQYYVENIEKDYYSRERENVNSGEEVAA